MPARLSMRCSMNASHWPLPIFANGKGSNLTLSALATRH
ncbi:hypothetical protein QFZ94_003663 [Paraburkholderia sp. JPY465]